MTEPTIICPNCKTEIRLTESLAAPLIAATRQQFERQLAQKDEDIVKRNFINNVIPQICNKLYPQIRTNIETSTREVQAAYKSMLDEKLEQLQNSIASVKEQKAQKVETFAAYQGYITEDIAAIQKMLQQLR